MKTKIFLQKGLDSQITDLPSGKSVRHFPDAQLRT
jgi:hypothetical protein